MVLEIKPDRILLDSWHVLRKTWIIWIANEKCDLYEVSVVVSRGHKYEICKVQFWRFE